MRASDFLEDVESHAFGVPTVSARFRRELAAQLRQGPLDQTSDVEAAVALARLIHDELEIYGTSGSPHLSEEDMNGALRTLHAVLDRIGLGDFTIPFRDFSSFRAY